MRASGSKNAGRRRIAEPPQRWIVLLRGQRLDDEAMSTGLDKYDLQKMLHENMEELQASPVIKMGVFSGVISKSGRAKQAN